MLFATKSKKERHINMKKIVTLFFLLVAIGTLSLSGCKKEEENKVMIAKQYGIAYAPLQIMEEKGFLEEILGEETTVEWVKLGNTAAIREAMLANDLDVGFMGIPPFLIGADQGMEWKILSGLSESPLGLVTFDPSIQNLGDLIGAGKIALPQPGSIQHILLSMEAEKSLGQSNVFDQQLVSLNHPDGYQALLVDDSVVAHYTAPPYLFDELKEENARLLASGRQAMGEPFTFIVGACREPFYENTNYYNGLQEALKMSIEYIQNNPEETLAILSDVYEMDEETLRTYIYHEDMVYTQEIKGIERFIEFMYQEDYLKKQWKADDVLW